MNPSRTASAQPSTRSDTPCRVRRDWHPKLSGPAVARYSATTPELLAWFGKLNADRPYRAQVRPFGFMLSATAEPQLSETLVSAESPRRKATPRIKPVAPFDCDHAKALPLAFDRDTGQPVPPDHLASYADALRQYHIYLEAKFLNGDYLDRDTTRRWHVRMTRVRHIGKESNDWERQYYLGLSLEMQPNYGLSDTCRERLFAELTFAIEREGAASAAKSLGITAARLRSISADSLPAAIAARLPDALASFDRDRADRAGELAELGEAAASDGLRATARRLGIHPSNLRRKLANILPTAGEDN